MIPLCDKTRELFAPPKTRFEPGDILDVNLADDGDLILDAYQFETLPSGNVVRVSPSIAMSSVLQRLPENKKLAAADGKSWYNPIKTGFTDCTVELLSALIPPDALRFCDREIRDKWTLIFTTSMLADNVAKMIADYKINSIIPPHHLEMSADSPLLPYQQVGLLASYQQQGFGLFMEQGTGKTPIAIAAICNRAVEYRKQGLPGLYKAIVVCPKTVQRNWSDEFGHFATRAGRVTILRGTPQNRLKLLCDAFTPHGAEDLYYSVIVCGPQALWRTWEYLRVINWNMAIVDEAQLMKDHEATQSEACIVLRDHSEHRLALTGTPTANSPLDVYNILEFLEKGGSGFSSPETFRKFYGTFDQGRLSGHQNLPLLQERLARKSFFISKKEALPDLPPQLFDTVNIEMPTEQRKAYDDLATQLAFEIEDDMNNDNLTREMLISCTLTKLLRLSQVTSGFVTWDKIVGFNGEIVQPATYEYFTPNLKIEACLDLFYSLDETEKMIIWANWIPDVEYIRSAFEANGFDVAMIRGLDKGYKEADREESIRKFNEDTNCRLATGTASSGGAGLNLLGYKPHHGHEYKTDCTHVVYFSKDWSYLKWAQSRDRPHRRGTRRPVQYTSLICDDSIDEDIHDRVSQKQGTAIEVADLRKILAKALNMKV